MKTSIATNTQRKRVVALATIGFVMAAGLGAVIVAPSASSSGKSTTIAATSGSESFSKISRVSGGWRASCRADYCRKVADLHAVSLPEAWSGQRVQLTVTVTFDMRMKGTEHATVRTYLAGAGRPSRVLLAPKTWPVTADTTKTDSYTLQYVRVVTVPQSPRVFLDVRAGAPAGKNHSISGSKAVWHVNAQALP